MVSARWAWKEGLVACMDMIQQHEGGEGTGYKAAYHTLHSTGELDCPRYREGWADGLEHYKHLKGGNLMSEITIYGFAVGCKYCDIAKNTLVDRGVDFKFVDVREDANTLALFKKVHNTVPQIYEDGKCMGGSEVAEFVGGEDYGDLSLD